VCNEVGYLGHLMTPSGLKPNNWNLDAVRYFPTSHSVSKAESNYAVTNLAVVWAVTHFRYYLYGHNVIMITDHAAVKAILGAPNLTGQHAQW